MGGIDSTEMRSCCQATPYSVSFLQQLHNSTEAKIETTAFYKEMVGRNIGVLTAEEQNRMDLLDRKFQVTG